MEVVGVEKFAMAGGLAELKTTIVLTLFAPPSANVDEAAVAHRHR